jgi:solute carrier family 38 (sodium-coupled neutral amino acid transporter), member 11
MWKLAQIQKLCFSALMMRQPPNLYHKLSMSSFSVHCPTYETAAEAVFGKAGFQFITLNMMVMSYGAMLSYLMIIKDSFSVVLGVAEDDLPMKRAILVIISLAIIVPLSCRRDVADLAFTSRLNVIIDSCIVGLVVYNAPSREMIQSLGGWKHLLLHDVIHYDTIFVGLGVLSFAFVCQHSAFIIAGSLERPTVARWSTVTGYALIFCAGLALTMGAAGYTGYMGKTEGNILNNMDENSWTANVARTMLGITMLFVYPLESFVCRHVFIVLFFTGRRAHEGEDSTILNRRDRRIGLTVMLYLSALIPAAMCKNFGSVLAVTGAIGGSSLSYIGPGLVYLGVHGERFLELVEATWLGSMLTSASSATSTSNSRKKRPPKTAPVETLAAVEHTPLFATNKGENEDQPQPQPKEFWLLFVVKTIIWHLLLMPIWCWIAATGRTGLNKHIHDMALKSPHPIRIGDVEYHRTNTAATAIDTDGDTDEEEGPRVSSLRREGGSAGSLPLVLAKAKIQQQKLGGPQQHAIVAVSPHSTKLLSSTGGTSNIDQLLGKQILQRQQQQQQGQGSSNQTDAMEKDPQESPPSWFDFYIAIFYMLFGILAVVAGLLSIAAEK